MKHTFELAWNYYWIFTTFFSNFVVIYWKAKEEKKGRNCGEIEERFEEFIATSSTMKFIFESPRGIIIPYLSEFSSFN